MAESADHSYCELCFLTLLKFSFGNPPCLLVDFFPSQIIMPNNRQSLWNGFYANGNSYAQGGAWVNEIHSIYQHFNTPAYLSNPTLYSPFNNGSTSYSQGSSSAPFVHYFNTTGIMQHNDIGPQWHPTDVGHIKLASHLIEYIRMKFDWVLYATGPEVYHQTEYWNDQDSY